VVTVGVNGSIDTAAAQLTNQDYVRRIDRDHGRLRLYVTDGATAIPHVLRLLDHAGVTLGEMELHRPSLDDVFLTKTGRSLRES
jgi:ABC-2 type transport system ATP-binding protein